MSLPGQSTTVLRIQQIGCADSIPILARSFNSFEKSLAFRKLFKILTKPDCKIFRDAKWFHYLKQVGKPTEFPEKKIFLEGMCSLIEIESGVGAVVLTTYEISFRDDMEVVIVCSET